jgi:asparagine synthase (glutamine-hydrolysing)
MCGIIATASMSPLAETSIAWIVEGMKCLSHRGPDDKGKWISSSSTIALSHYRLSVIDLSSGGHQPIVSTGGSCVLTFNGEIN